MHPIDTVKTQVQASSALSFIEIMSKLPQLGFRGLYLGSIPAIVGQFLRSANGSNKAAAFLSCSFSLDSKQAIIANSCSIGTADGLRFCMSDNSGGSVPWND
ncbi:uncharacterized protein LOC125201880 [Salvia hispanica]|uniref:uncharacterized protein LOC125201880 n=1 Tax=Salvia hispanica TaxID=49212 RepID=UPI002009BE96|nr:uncharacterized protein LOC125201880 [Salvia hispanica]